MAWGTRTLKFDCSKCNEEVGDEDFDLPGFDYSSESHADGIGTEDVDVECPECGKEYVVEIINSFDRLEATIHAEPKIHVKLSVVEIPDWDDEFDYQDYLKSYVPSEPYARYEHSLELIVDMLTSAKAVTSYPVFQRMLFLQYMAMMEAYLCDRLVLLVSGVETVRVKLIQGYAKLQNQSYPMVAYASDPNLISKKTAAFLKAQLYHELDEVDKLYESALGTSPFLDERHKKFLKEATINRHHCVHREGKDNDGMVLTEVNEAYVKEVGAQITALVQNIEKVYEAEILKIRPEPPF